jgi:nucleoside-diphosphate-sugar epimerase
MRVLVIGGTGFLGPHVVRQLGDLGHEVVVYHRGEHEPQLPDGIRHVHSPVAGYPVLEFPPALTELAPDLVLHMTPMGEPDAIAARRAFRGIARRLVALSSGDVYRAYGICTGLEAGSPVPVPLSEAAPLRRVLYPYQGTGLPLADVYEKILVERELSSDPALPATILRLPAVYGPGDPYRRFADFLRPMRDGSAAIPLGRGYARWRWTHGYVENVARAVVLAVTVDRARGRTYNVGEGETPETAERVRRIGRAAGWMGEVAEVPDEELPPPFPKRLDFTQDVVLDTARIREELGYRDVVDEAEALGRTVAWERELEG